ncbi:HIF1A [Bugula neritina]|uniref:HIF1A n=1 Tax=Bugula neritina TaxID=10212 RepID=A0A7J7KHY7_BUGNE|nr:HIF1A [Bugula neritina]
MSLSKKAAEKRRLAEKRKELRKEKSKEAARNRRGKEGEFFAELADTLPLANSLKQSLDKSTVIKLCINYMRLRELLQDVFPATNVSQKLPLNIFSMRDEFELVLSLSPFGDIVYATDNVKDLLGLYQYDMIGCGLSTLMHPSDWNEFEEFYKSGESSISVTARFKSSLAAKSRSTANGKNPQYKTVKFIGRRLTAPSSSSPGKDSKDGCVILTGSPVETLAVSEQVIDSMTFTCKHTLSMRLTDCDERFTELTRYPAGYAKEKSFYSFVHPGDMKSVETHFKSLYSKETIQTEPYRLLTGYGGYVEVVTVASLVNNLKTGKPEAITTIHHVIWYLFGL